MKKNFAFLILSALLVVFYSCKESERKKTNFPNYLKNTNWIVNEGGLIAPDGGKTYYMSPRIDTAVIFNFHAVNFLDEEKFRSYDAWECGNDCFTEVHGRYYFTEAIVSLFKVSSIFIWRHIKLHRIQLGKQLKRYILHIIYAFYLFKISKCYSFLCNFSFHFICF